MAIWQRLPCWISKTTRAQAHARVRAPPPSPPTNTQKYLMLFAFLRQQWLRYITLAVLLCFAVS